MSYRTRTFKTFFLLLNYYNCYENPDYCVLVLNNLALVFPQFIGGKNSNTKGNIFNLNLLISIIQNKILTKK